MKKTVATTVLVELREAIVEGQHVDRYEVHARTSGGWQIVSDGSTIGNRKLDRTDGPVTATRLRLSIESALDVPRISTIGLYRGGANLPAPGQDLSLRR